MCDVAIARQVNLSSIGSFDFSVQDAHCYKQKSLARPHMKKMSFFSAEFQAVDAFLCKSRHLLIFVIG